MKKYYQNYSTITILITITVILIIASVILNSNSELSYLLLLPLLLIIVNVPIYYYMDNDQLIIRKMFWNINIDSPAAVKVRVTQPFVIYSMGFMGYIGYTSDGCYSLTANLKKSLLIKGKSGKNFIISPRNSEIFINNLNQN